MLKNSRSICLDNSLQIYACDLFYYEKYYTSVSEIMKSKDVKWHILKKLNPMYFKYYDNTTLKVFLINIECKSNLLKSKSKKKKKKGKEI